MEMENESMRSLIQKSRHEWEKYLDLSPFFWTEIQKGEEKRELLETARIGAG